MNSCCNQIDDYLDGDLTEQEQAAWLALARDCPHCQEILKRQREVDGLLDAAWSMVQPEANDLPLCEPVSQSGRRSRHVIAGAFALAASISLIALVFYHTFAPADSTGRKPEEVVSIDVSPPTIEQHVDQRREVETVVTSSHGLVIPIADEPEFTIVQFVPEFVPAAASTEN